MKQSSRFIRESSYGNYLEFCYLNPTTRIYSRTSSRWSSSKKSFIKDKMIGRVDILWRNFEKRIYRPFQSFCLLWNVLDRENLILLREVRCTSPDFIKKVFSVYIHSMATIYPSLSAQVAKSTLFMKSPVSKCQFVLPL